MLATPYWTEAQLDSAQAASGTASLIRHGETGNRSHSRSLDDIAYFVKYRQLCDFLASMQVTTPGANLGGMREGEVGSDFNIIQTDNTQEAIRVWSQYSIWTGDTARYAQNIRNAWTYCTVWPAWREEGGGYYAMHNCGWGFEAAYKYREAYGDTSKNWYADSCAWWVNGNPLSLTSILNIAAQGLGIGGMYPHAVYRGRTDWQDFTLGRARIIRNWFQANPSRLNTETSWALCAGTAIWGVCNSLWIAYPDSGATWINQYGTNLETWESPSSWYNAFNTWYSNATFRFWEISGDSLYWHRGVFYADSLVGFDVDNDGGIPPGTCCISNGNDHTWVSAYMGWMGLERIISSAPISFVDAVGFSSPSEDAAYLAGDPLPVTALVANQGTEALQGRVWVWGLNYSDSADFTAGAGDVVEVPMSNLWTLADNSTLPESPMLFSRVRVILEGDTLQALDSAGFDIRRGGIVQGTISGEFDIATSPACLIEFYSDSYPDSLWHSVNVGAGEMYSNGARRLLSGGNRMVVYGPARYLIEEIAFYPLTPEENPDDLDVYLTSSDVLLVDDDLGQSYENYILSALDANDRNVRVWDRQSTVLGDLSNVPWLIWMTGNDAVTTLDAQDHNTLTGFMLAGGGVLLTGQNITDDPQNEDFLRDIMRCEEDRSDTDVLRAYGLGDDPDVDGQFLLLLGSQGAQNQTSPSSITLLNGATAIFVNDTITEEVCGVSGLHGSGKFIFLSFGLEGASGQAGSTSRSVFLSAAEDWLTAPLQATIDPPVVWNFELLPSFPNPFNGQVQIRWLAPDNSSRTTLQVYNLLGRHVTTLFDGFGKIGQNLVTWNGATSSGVPVSSGTYLVRLTTPDATLSHSIRFIR